MMYRISSTNKFSNGQKLNSLAEAKDVADSCAERGETVDVISLEDGKEFRVAYTPSTCLGGQANRETFKCC